MKTRFLLLLFTVIFICSPMLSYAGIWESIEDEVSVNGVDIDLKPRLGLSFSGTFSAPAEGFGKSYDDFSGFSFGAGVAMVAEENPGLNIGKYLLEISFDKVPLKDEMLTQFGLTEDVEATLIGIHFTEAQGVPIIIADEFAITPFLGESIGGSVFTLDDEDYSFFGGHTLTELNEENDRLQLSYCNKLGVSLAGINHFSLDYSYDLVTVERSWLFWHLAVSGIVNAIAIEAVPALLGMPFPDDVTESLPFQLTVLAYQMGLTYWWYDNDYENHNWPYDDESPLHFTRHMATLNFYF